jgi:hypothetical protein
MIGGADICVDRVLPKRLAVSIKEGTKHNAAFEVFTKGLEATRADEVAEWREQVLTWETLTRPTLADSPFEQMEEGMSECQSGEMTEN